MIINLSQGGRPSNHLHGFIRRTRVTLGAVKWCAAGLATVIALFLTSHSGALADENRSLTMVDRYLITATVQPDGSLDVIESITFADDASIPPNFTDSLGSWRVPDDPGRIQTFDEQVEISDSTPRSVRATYTVTGAFRIFSAAELDEANPLGLKAGDAELFAQIIGPLTDLSVGEARIDVRTPSAALAAACFVDGQSIPVCTDRIGDTETTFRSLDLAPGASMSIALILDGETVTVPDARPATSTPRGPEPWLIALVLLGAAAIGVVIARRTRSSSPGE